MAKILNVISAVTPFGGTIAKLRVLMTQSTCHQHFLYQPSFKSEESLILENIDWYKQHGVPASYSLCGRNIFKNALNVTRLIKKYNIDIVHFYFNHEQSFAWLVKMMNPRVKMVRSIVGYDRRLSPFRRLVVGLSLRSVDYYILISRYIKELYEKEYPILKKKHSQIIYNGAVHVSVSTKDVSERKYIVSLGGLCERKNSMVLIEAMNIIVNQYGRKDIVLNLLGDGPERKAFEEKIKEYHLENAVNLVGYASNVPEWLDDAAVYVHPAITEGFGIAVVEAMQMHCPCVVADKGALPELIIDGEDGFVVDAFDASVWALKIVELFDDKQMSKVMGENAYHRALTHFSLDAFVKHHDDFYNELYSL